MLVCQKTESLNENSFIFTFLHLKKKKQAKEWTPTGKAKKENPAKKFYSESEDEEDSSDSSSDSGRCYNLFKDLVHCSLHAVCLQQNNKT